MHDPFSAPYPDSHSHARCQPVDDRHEAIDGKPSEVRIADPREVGGLAPDAALTVRCSRQSALMIPAARIALNCSASALVSPRSRSTSRSRALHPVVRFSSRHFENARPGRQCRSISARVMSQPGGNTVHFVGQTIAFRGLSPLEPGRRQKLIVCPTTSPRK